MNLTGNPKILEIQFLTPFIQTAAYGGTHRPVERIVLRTRKIVEGRPTEEWETPREYLGWSARVEGPSVFIRPAMSGSLDTLPEEWEIPRAHVGIRWDRTDELRAADAETTAKAMK